MTSSGRRSSPSSRRTADHRRAERGRPRGLGRGQPRVRPGYDDLVEPRDEAVRRDHQPVRWSSGRASPRTPPQGGDSRHALPDTWIEDRGRHQGRLRRRGHRGPSVPGEPRRHRGHRVTDIVDEVNASAEKLKADGADVDRAAGPRGCGQHVVAPRRPTRTPRSARSSTVSTGKAARSYQVPRTSPTTARWRYPIGDRGRTVTERPVVSAGQYGSFLDKLVFKVDPVTGDVLTKTPEPVALVLHRRHACTAAGPPPRRRTSRPTRRSSRSPTTRSPRRTCWVPRCSARSPVRSTGPRSATVSRRRTGVASPPPANLVAEVQKWATQAPNKGGAQIAFMNPGGIRTDLVGTGTGAFPRDLTYRQAAEMQPFANGLVNMRLTGAQIKADTRAAVAARRRRDRPIASVPAARHVQGLRVAYDPSRPEGDRHGHVAQRRADRVGHHLLGDRQQLPRCRW